MYEHWWTLSGPGRPADQSDHSTQHTSESFPERSVADAPAFHASQPHLLVGGLVRRGNSVRCIMDHDDHDDNKEVHAAELELGYQTGLGFGQALASTKPRSQERANLSAQRPTLSRESTRQKELQRLERQEGIQPIVNPTGLVSREEPQLTMPVRAGNCEREVAHLRGMKSRTLSVAGKKNL